MAKPHESTEEDLRPTEIVFETRFAFIIAWRITKLLKLFIDHYRRHGIKLSIKEAFPPNAENRMYLFVESGSTIISMIEVLDEY